MLVEASFGAKEKDQYDEINPGEEPVEIDNVNDHPSKPSNVFDSLMKVR